MAESEMVTIKDGAWKIDVDTFAPKPEGYLKVLGVEYPIYSFLDIPMGDSFRVARLAEDIKGTESYEARMARGVEQILLLNKPAVRAGQPVLTEKHFEDISPREILTMTV